MGKERPARRNTFHPLYSHHDPASCDASTQTHKKGWQTEKAYTHHRDSSPRQDWSALVQSSTRSCSDFAVAGDVCSSRCTVKVAQDTKHQARRIASSRIRVRIACSNAHVHVNKFRIRPLCFLAEVFSLREGTAAALVSVAVEDVRAACDAEHEAPRATSST